MRGNARSLFSLFIRTLQPPRSTLFPYTTLFRSMLEADAHDIVFASGTVGVAGVPGRVLSWADLAAAAADSSRLPEGMDPGDRKSTRLNSSHPSISYAVFCLKKKNRSLVYKILRQ